MRKIWDIYAWFATYFVGMLYGYYFLSWPGVFLVIAAVLGHLHVNRVGHA